MRFLPVPALTFLWLVNAEGDVWRGLPKFKQREYMKDPFQCLDGQRTIPRARINDDFCDCIDGSDEPGTSACPNAQFYCAPRKGTKGEFIPSSRVNDGVCDCCHGGDEDVVDCEDVCGGETEQILNKLKLGLLMRKGYVEAAQTALKAQEQHGPEGVLLSISNSCHKIESGVFTYTVCLHQDARQNEKGKSGDQGTLVGTFEKLMVDPDTHQMIMLFSNGDSCGEDVKRSLRLSFECLDENRILEEKEPKMCSYEMRFGSPAACDREHAMATLEALGLTETDASSDLGNENQNILSEIENLYTTHQKEEL